MSKFKTLIAGVGNSYRHDDGVGLEIIKILRAKNNHDQRVIHFFDGGTNGFSLLDKLSLYERAVIIDVVFMGTTPGTTKLFTPKEAKFVIKSDTLSTHGFGLAELLKVAEELDIKTEIKIIGIEPVDIDFGEGLSDVVINKIPQILDLIESNILDVTTRHFFN